MKRAHMGHFAKSFGLKEQPNVFIKKHTQPKSLPPTNRLTYTERDPERVKLERRNKRHLYTTTFNGNVQNKHPVKPTTFAGDQQNRETNTLLKSLSKSRILNMSEFDSGLQPVKKRKH